MPNDMTEHTPLGVSPDTLQTHTTPHSRFLSSCLRGFLMKIRYQRGVQNVCSLTKNASSLSCLMGGGGVLLDEV